MSHSDHQVSCALRAIEAIYDLADALGAEHEHVHAACMAARSCILLAAALAEVPAPGVGAPDDHARRARDFLWAARRARRHARGECGTCGYAPCACDQA